MATRREAFGAGAAAVVPMLPGIAPFGVIAGLTAIATGLTTVQAMVLSGLVFAGASQLAMLQLVAEGAIPAVILLTVITINLRFAMYSASLAPHFQHLGRRWRLPLAALLVDQNYATTIQRYLHGGDAARRHGHWFYLGGGVTLWLTWQTATAVGVFMGTGVPREWSLDFAIPLVFLVLLVPALSDRAHVVAALTGGLVATLATDLPLHLGIVAGAASGIAAGLLAEARHGTDAVR
ncbi:MAG: AzlC family ABC transporter permease [Gammaproteobacteria bacterium]|nr:AzlC family ABC transporter permease [Gammaproteobacteria bacterium]